MFGPVSTSLIVPLALRWAAPAECPQVDVVRARLAATVSASLASGADADVTVTGNDAGRFVATIREGDGGLRTLEESTCDVLADAVVTVLALSLGSPAAPATVPAPAPVSAPARESAVRSDPRFAAGLLVRIDHGTLPSTALGGGAQIAWYPLRTLRVEGSVARWFGQNAAVGEASFGGSFRLTSGTLRSCWSPLGEAITVGPCLGLDVDHVDGSGYGSSHVADGSSTWFAPSVGALARWTPLRFFAVTALADVAFPVSRPSFYIEGGGAIYRPSAAALRGQIAAEVRFW